MQALCILKYQKNAQWLSGEGAGSWFTLNAVNNILHVNRFSPNGTLECSEFFESKNNLDLTNFKITYPSNCIEHTLVNNGKKTSFIKNP